ncbi:MAG: FAD-binding oxidoreductase, partial [Betaproteobacteria bacterium]|nr:FAD-binding oxidoreductase [Betaproteobacteria bacterium]
MASNPQPDLALPAFFQDLASIVGTPHVLTEPADTAPFFTDWRRVFPGAGIGAVRPANTDEVSRVVA